MSKLTTILLLLVATLPLRATTLVPADVSELAHDAIAVARGRIAAVDAQWTGDRRTIETIVTLDVERYLKGNLGPQVQFRVPGGRLGRFRSVVVGAPVFAADDRVVVFLGARGPSVPHLVGFSQGVYRVMQVSGRAMVRGDVAHTPVPLSDFESRVRSLAGTR